MHQLIGLIYTVWALLFVDVHASIAFTNQNYDGIQAGVPFTLTWRDASGPVTLGFIFKRTENSPQNSTIIASGITDSQFAWTPPDFTSSVFEQVIEAQDSENQILTGNFMIAKAGSGTTLNQQTTNPTLIAAKTVNAQPTSAASATVTSPPRDSAEATATATATPHTRLSSAAQVRLGFGIGIVVVLITAGIALIFFEHGKRIASRTEQPASFIERAERGDGEQSRNIGLELMETRFTNLKESEKDSVEEEPSSPLLYKKPKVAMPVELDGGMLGSGNKNILKNKKKEESTGDKRQSRIKKVFSVRSVYELG